MVMQLLLYSGLLLVFGVVPCFIGFCIIANLMVSISEDLKQLSGDAPEWDSGAF